MPRPLLSFLMIFLLGTIESSPGEATRHIAPGLEDAHLVYQEKYATAAEGVYEEDGLLFVIVRLIDGSRDGNTLKARAMLRSKTLLQDHISQHYLDPTQKPEPGALRKYVPESMRFGREAVATLGIPSLGGNYRIRVLEDKSAKSGEYHYGIALSLHDIQANIPATLYGEPTDNEIAEALRKTWIQREKSGRLPEMCLAFDLVDDIMRLNHDRIAEDWPGAPWLAIPASMSSRELADAWQRTKLMLAQGSATIPALKKALGSAPLLPETLKWLESSAMNNKDFYSALLWRSWRSGVAGISEFFSEPRQLTVFRTAALDAEYLSILKALNKSDAFPTFASAATSASASSWASFGYADFFGMPDALPDQYPTAMKLYDEGREVDKILYLAIQAADKAPGNAACWSLLGRALLAKGSAAAALPFFRQSLLLDPANAENRTFMAIAYAESGCKQLAVGMAASVFFACKEVSKWSETKALSIIQNASLQP